MLLVVISSLFAVCCLVVVGRCSLFVVCYVLCDVCNMLFVV